MRNKKFSQPPPNRERLMQSLKYDPEQGHLIWKVGNHGRYIGKIAGCNDAEGYRRLSFERVTYRAHRLIWFMVYGEWPLLEIDHINGDPGDNRLSNLRLATTSQNHWNTRRHVDNKLGGSKGVTKAGGRWQARISIGVKKRIHLGYFGSQEEAARAYRTAAAKYHGEFARFD